MSFPASFSFRSAWLRLRLFFTRLDQEHGALFYALAMIAIVTLWSLFLIARLKDQVGGSWMEPGSISIRFDSGPSTRRLDSF